MVCYDSGLVIHVTHLRNMLFICTLIFQKLDVNLQGFFFLFWETETKLFSFLLHLLPGICSGSLSCVLRPQPWKEGRCPQKGFPAAMRELGMFPPVFLKCPSATSAFCCVCMSPENSCACWWPLPSDQTKKLHMCSIRHHFTGDFPKRKEGGYVIMKSDAFPSWILMDKLAPG